jgi:hypothetical protein
MLMITKLHKAFSGSKVIVLIKKKGFIHDRVGKFRRLPVMVLLLGIGGIWLASCLNNGTDQLDEPLISVSPQSGGANTEVVVSGENFPAGTAVMLRLGPPDVGATPNSYGSAVADGDGRFTLTFLVPESWPDGTPITTPELTVIVINEDGSVKATAPFAFQPGVIVEPTFQNTDGVTTPDPLLVATEQAIVTAVTDYLTQTGQSTEAAIAVEQIEGDFARVGIHPLTADSETKATGFLKSDNSVWEVLVVGRNFDSDQLLELGIPPAILPEDLLELEG